MHARENGRRITRNVLVLFFFYILTGKKWEKMKMCQRWCKWIIDCIPCGRNERNSIATSNSMYIRSFDICTIRLWSRLFNQNEIQGRVDLLMSYKGKKRFSIESSIEIFNDRRRPLPPGCITFFIQYPMEICRRKSIHTQSTKVI